MKTWRQVKGRVAIYLALIVLAVSVVIGGFGMHATRVATDPVKVAVNWNSSPQHLGVGELPVDVKP